MPASRMPEVMPVSHETKATSAVTAEVGDDDLDGVLDALDQSDRWGRLCSNGVIPLTSPPLYRRPIFAAGPGAVDRQEVFPVVSPLAAVARERGLRPASVMPLPSHRSSSSSVQPASGLPSSSILFFDGSVPFLPRTASMDDFDAIASFRYGSTLASQPSPAGTSSALATSLRFGSGDQLLQSTFSQRSLLLEPPLDRHGAPLLAGQPSARYNFDERVPPVTRAMTRANANSRYGGVADTRADNLLQRYPSQSGEEMGSLASGRGGTLPSSRTAMHSSNMKKTRG
jgi:hypothetical protein